MSTFKRLTVLAVAALSLVSFAAPAYAGEDGDDEPRRHRVSGGGDSGSASGGAQTGFGGMAVDNQDSATTAIGLAGGGLLVLTAAGLVARRREIEVGA